MYFVCSAYLSIKSPAVLRYSQQGWHPNDFSLPKACLQCVSSIWNSLLIVSGLRGMHILQYYFLSGHHLYRPCFSSPWLCMKASSADTQGAGLSDSKLVARTENWIPSGECFATSSDHSNLHFLSLCWRLLKSGTLVVLGIIFSTAFFGFFFPFAWFSLVFCYIFGDLKVLLNPCTAGVGSCRDQGTVHFFLGQQWLTECIETLNIRCLFSLTLEKSSPPLVQSSFWLALLLQSCWELSKDGLAGSRSKAQGRRLVVKSLSFVLIIALKKKKYNTIVLLADQAPGRKDAGEYKMCFTEIRWNVYLENNATGVVYIGNEDTGEDYFFFFPKLPSKEGPASTDRSRSPPKFIEAAFEKARSLPRAPQFCAEPFLSQGLDPSVAVVSVCF